MSQSMKLETEEIKGYWCNDEMILAAIKEINYMYGSDKDRVH